jgi:hypothetical protein
MKVDLYSHSAGLAFGRFDKPYDRVRCASPTRYQPPMSARLGLIVDF